MIIVFRFGQRDLSGDGGALLVVRFFYLASDGDLGFQRLDLGLIRFKQFVVLTGFRFKRRDLALYLCKLGFYFGEHRLAFFKFLLDVEYRALGGDFFRRPCDSQHRREHNRKKQERGQPSYVFFHCFPFGVKP